ncbi:hypothetical protein [Microcoleus asticus]|uniref:hypothetical protein n=1 Tax=Microcoleus asticus TaxID=2815231 RepID=UPI001C12F286|nr:hypothetical protein [Microcoleus asticus]
MRSPISRKVDRPINPSTQKSDRPNQHTNPIAHFSQIRSPDQQKTRSPIHQKLDRTSTKNSIAPSTKNPIAHFSQIRSPHQQKTRSAGLQKPGFYRNSSLQLTDSAKNPVSFVGGEGPETWFFTKILDYSPEIR